MHSNREDRQVLILFFNALKTRVGDLFPAWFMSDMAEQYYTAWVSSFQNRPHKLLCSWHIDIGTLMLRHSIEYLSTSTSKAALTRGWINVCMFY